MSFQLHPTGFWFRIFKFGLRVIDRTKQPAPFSVRQSGEFRLGRWGIKTLTRA